MGAEAVTPLGPAYCVTQQLLLLRILSFAYHTETISA